MADAPLRIGTRGSQLALWQAHAVAAGITGSGGPPCEMVIVRTAGDTNTEQPLSAIGGKRLFVKEIEAALLEGTIDLAVHSSKDLPAELPDGLVIAGVLARADPLDAIVLPDSAPALQEVPAVDAMVAALGRSPRLGTGSVRRIAQLKRLMTGARFGSIRGNLDTRLRKLDAGEYDAIVLAAAGLRRLGFTERISLSLPVDACVPAPGQGIIAVEVRDGDRRAQRAARLVNDASAAVALEAERALVVTLGGGCQMPVGALATTPDPATLELVATVVSLDGEDALKAHITGAWSDAARLGAEAGKQLLADGAAGILGT